MTVQADGKVVVAARIQQTGGAQDIFVARYLKNGRLDTTFGTGGKVTLDFGSSDEPAGIVVDADGNVLVGGAGSSGFTVARLTKSGMLDSTFGVAGLATATVGSGDKANALATDASGNLIQVGQTSLAGDKAFAAARYLADGTLDTSFGSAGTATVNFGTGFDVANAVAIQSDGSVVMAGEMDMPGGKAFVAITRLLSTGVLDTSFGTSGLVTNGFGTTLASATGVAIQSDGKIVVVGNAFTGASSEYTVARYNADGTLDSGFGTGGVVFTPLSTNDLASDIVVNAAGTISIAGTTRVGISPNFAVVRYRPDGSLDSSFGTGGVSKVKIGFGGFASGLAEQTNGKLVVVGYAFYPLGSFSLALARFQVASTLPNPTVPPPVLDTRVIGSGGTTFTEFGSPAVDGGMVGGLAKVVSGQTKKTIIYRDSDPTPIVATGENDDVGATFLEFGDPLFAGEALGFAATARQVAAMGVGESQGRAFVVRPGGKLMALYSQMTKAGGIKRLAAQTDAAPGVSGGQFAKFGGFGLPRERGGLVFTANLHRGGIVTAKNDFGVWREKSTGGDSDLLLQNDSALALTAGGTRHVKKVSLMTPVTGQTDQRRSVGPDGEVAAASTFADGSSGIVVAAANGSITVPLETTSSVPDELGVAESGVQFTAFHPPATAGSGVVALLAALKAGRVSGEAVFSNQAGSMRRVVSRGDEVLDGSGVRWGKLGDPAIGKKGVVALMAALTGKSVTAATRQAILRSDAGLQTIVARLGDEAPGFGGDAVFKRFVSMVVTDSDPARVVFTAVIGGPGITAASNLGLWSHSASGGTTLVMRKGGTIKIGADTPAIRVFETLQAPRKSVGQGRSTDASGFVTARATLSDGRKGVLRIPLP